MKTKKNKSHNASQQNQLYTTKFLLSCSNLTRNLLEFVIIKKNSIYYLLIYLNYYKKRSRNQLFNRESLEPKPKLKPIKFFKGSLTLINNNTQQSRDYIN